MADGIDAVPGGFPGRHRVGIIVLNYNNAALTLRCVESVLEHTSKTLDYAVLVVDNASVAREREALSPLSELPRVRVIASRVNLGFGGGHLFGVQFLAAEHYLFLNSDCRFRNDAAGALLEFMEHTPGAGLVSGVIVDANGEFRRNFHPAPHVAELLLGRAFLRLLRPGRYPARRHEPVEPLAVEVLSGAALWVRAEAFFAVGGFDPFFFLYCEEEDLALRLRRAGWEVWVVPAARVEHVGGGSTPRDPVYRREFYISFLHYFRKHHGAVALLAIRVLYALKLLRRVRRDPASRSLAWFVLRGAPPSASLRFHPESRDPR